MRASLKYPSTRVRRIFLRGFIASFRYRDLLAFHRTEPVFGFQRRANCTVALNGAINHRVRENNASGVGSHYGIVDRVLRSSGDFARHCLHRLIALFSRANPGLPMCSVASRCKSCKNRSCASGNPCRRHSRRLPISRSARMALPAVVVEKSLCLFRVHGLPHQC